MLKQSLWSATTFKLTTNNENSGKQTSGVSEKNRRKSKQSSLTTTITTTISSNIIPSNRNMYFLILCVSRFSIEGSLILSECEWQLVL